MKKRTIAIIMLIVILLVQCSVAFAHSGRTDASGGHRDKNNVSGLGYYHYHCGGHPAHLHTNGVCPYSGGASVGGASVSGASAGTEQRFDNLFTPRNDDLVPLPSLDSFDDVVIPTAEIINLPVNNTVRVGEGWCFAAKRNPWNDSVQWGTKGDWRVATVDNNGFITARSPGVTTLYVITASGAAAEVTVSVID